MADECPTVCAGRLSPRGRAEGEDLVHTLSKAIVGIVLAGGVAGCANDSGPRYVERVPVAAPGAPETRFEYERPRPLPERSGRFDRELPPEPPFYDEPLVSQ